jgi:hypothetical protein
MKKEIEIEEVQKKSTSFQHFFSTITITLILLLILAFLGSTIYIGYNSFMSGH